MYLPSYACTDCRWGADRIVEDHVNGDYVCMGCGLVTGRLFVDSAEWRNFANDDNPREDNSRVGQVYDELLEGVGAGGVRTSVGGTGAEASRLRTMQARLQDSKETRMLRDYKEIQEYGERLGMSGDCVKAAKDIFKRCVEANVPLRADTRVATMAVCLFYGGRINTYVGVGRTIPEVLGACGLADNISAYNKAKQRVLEAVKDTHVWKKVAHIASNRQDALVRKIDIIDTGSVDRWTLVRAARTVDDFCRDNGVGQCQHQDKFMTSVIFVACRLLKIACAKNKKTFSTEMGISPALLTKNEGIIMQAFVTYEFRLQV